MKSIIIKIIFVFLIYKWILFKSLFGFQQPDLLQDFENNYSLSVGAAGIFFRSKYVTGPLDYKSNLFIYGVRGFGGILQDPKFGIYLLKGSDYNNSPSFELTQVAFTIENAFKPLKNSRLKWRVNFGGGKYQFRTNIIKLIIDEKDFTFIEPCLSYILPFTRHILIESTVGYTFSNSYNARIEGIVIEFGLLVGKF